MVQSREPFKFWWAPTIFLERLKLVIKFCTSAGYIKSQHMEDG